MLRIGIIGLDTSHAPAFARLLNDNADEFHVPGGRIVAAFPGGSADFGLSCSRIGKFTADLRDSQGVEIVSSISDLRGKCDALMIESIDGSVHLPQFREVVCWGIPVFFDKPLAISKQDARAILELAHASGVRVSSASALRFAVDFRGALEASPDPVIGADIFGPMEFVDNCPGYFWYGIHSAEMLFAAMGAGCCSVQAVREELHDVVVGRWADGRIGCMRGNRSGNSGFGGVIHRSSRNDVFSISAGSKPFYASLLEKVVAFFRGEDVLVPAPEMLEVIAFLEAANRSALTGDCECVWSDVDFEYLDKKSVE